MTARSLRWFHFALLLAYIGVCVAGRPHLPERIPLHFDFLGWVTAWVPASAAMWYLLPAIVTALILFIYAASSMPVPEMWNLSREDVKRFRALAPDVQARIVEAVQRSTAITLILVTIALMGLQLAVYVTAVKGSDRMPWYAQVLILGPIALVLLLAFHDRSKLRDQIRAAGPQQEDASRSGPEVSDGGASARRA